MNSNNLEYLNYQAPEGLLKDRVIMVTGAGDGIGKAAAKAFAAFGATVILLGRTIAKLEQVYDEIVEAGYLKPAIYPLDLAGATPENYVQMAEIIAREIGRLDGLLHNASVLGDLTLLENYPPDTWATVMQVNLTAPFLLTQALLPLMKKSTDASIVLTSSSVGRKGRAYWGAYGVSKFGTEGLMQTLAAELENTSNVRVNSLNPGATRTNMRASAYPAENPETLLRPEDILNAYLFLMGEDSKAITGHSLDAQAPKP